MTKIILVAALLFSGPFSCDDTRQPGGPSGGDGQVQCVKAPCP